MPAKSALAREEVSDEVLKRGTSQQWEAFHPTATAPLDVTELDKRARDLDLRRYQPMNDRVLLRRIEEKSEKVIVQPDAFALKSNKGEVIAVGSGMLVGMRIIPIDLKPGDTCLFGEYNCEPVLIEGEELLLVSAFDIRMKILP